MPKFENHQNYNCKITLESGKEYLIYANWLHNNSLDNWQGWDCEAGATRLFIDKDFGAYSGECKNDYLGSVLFNFDILPKTTCRKIRCTGCTDDLIVAKQLSSGSDLT